MSNPAAALHSLIVLLLALQLAGCSRTIQWEEEVPLNTGETIWVKREVIYVVSGGSGNPLDIKYRPEWTKTIEFEWQGHKYSYAGVADVMLIAISPETKRPVLVAPASNNGWDRRNNYRCTVPFYVQLTPDASGRNWTWPPSIEPWLYGMSYNVMRNSPKLNEIRHRYGIQERAKEDRRLLQDKYNLDQTRIDPTHSFSDCMK